MSQSPLMEVKDLRVWYNSYRGYAKVLDGVDLHIHRGEKIGLVGEAGCGKTTTMKALMHLLPERTAKIPTGELFLEGQALNPMPEKERAALLRRHISMVFQEPASALNPVFTIGDHMVDVVRSAEAAKGVRLSKKEGLERAAEALAQGEIEGPDLQVSVNLLCQTGGHMDGYLRGADLSASTEGFMPPAPGRPPFLVDGLEEMRRAVRQVIRAGS